MTAAELKTLRESLGLTTQWIADQAGVKLRTAQYWETGGRMAVPDDVATMITNIDHQIDHTASQTISQIDEISKVNDDPDEIVLVRYRTDRDLWRYKPDMKPLPASTHAILLSRVRRALWARNIPTLIEYMEPDEYQAWLGNRKDTEVERSSWAAARNIID